jgi:fructoselysine 6-kinase
MKAACFSVAAMDFFPQQKKYFAGGNALNQSIRLSSQGINCHFVGALGDDNHGNKIYSLLKQNNVDVALVEILKGHTANNRIINDDFGERFGEEGAWNGGVFENYKISEETWQKISNFDIWTTHSSCPNFQQTLARRGNSSLIVDYLHLPAFQVLADTITNVDIAYVGGDVEMIEKLAELSTKNTSLIVLTLGKSGSIAFYKGQQFMQPALPANVVDTTGCGDAFQAGFTYSYLRHNDIQQALLSGSELGRLASMHYGGVQW